MLPSWIRSSKVQTAVDVLLGDGNHQAEVGLHQVFLGPLGFDFAVADDGERVPQVHHVGPGHFLALADFAPDFAGFALRCRTRTPLDLAQVGFQARHLFRDLLDFLGEFLPLRKVVGQMPDRLGNLHPGALHLADPLAAQLLVAQRNRIQLVRYLAQLLVQDYQLGQLGANFVAALVVGGTLGLKVPEIDKGIELFGFVLDLIGDLDGPQLHQRGSANRLLHPQLAALHATR